MKKRKKLKVGNSEKQKEYALYLETEEWKAKRQATLYRDGNKCRLCNSSRQLQVHHRCYPKVYGEEPLIDLITLCYKCHAKFHDKKITKAIKKKVDNEAEIKVLIEDQKKDMRTVIIRRNVVKCI